MRLKRQISPPKPVTPQHMPQDPTYQFWGGYVMFLGRGCENKILDVTWCLLDVTCSRHSNT